MAIIYWKVDGTTLKLRSGSASGYLDFDDEFPGAPDWISYTYVTKVIIENNISPSNMYAWFMDFTKVTEIQYIQRINTSNVTDMSHTFRNCQTLTTLDVSGFNTSNVTHMGSMFYGCYALTSLDVSHFDTSKVTNMGGMFCNCRVLTSLDISGFNTSNVTDMSYMFAECRTLTSLDVSHFDTSKVTNMSFMFNNCYVLTSPLDVSHFNTSKVTNMSHMFSQCRTLTSLDVSGFDTSNVTNMSQMFQNCQALTSLNVSSFNTSNVTNMVSMFYNCQALTSLDLSNFNTSNVTNMASMFQGCQTLTTLDVSEFDTSNVTIMIGMFYDCQALISLNLSNFNTSNVTNMSQMFQDCQALTTIIVSSTLFKTTQVTSSSDMFSGCTNLIGGKGTSYNSSYIDKTYARGDDAPTTPGYFTGIANCASFDSTDGTLEIFYTGVTHTNGEVVDTKTYYTNIDQITGNTIPKWYSIRNSITKVIIEDLFRPKTGYCLFSSAILEEIENISKLNTSNVTTMSYMFQNCYALTSLDVSGFDTSNVANMYAMFSFCQALTSLDVSGFDTSSVTNMSLMFDNCQALTSLDVSGFNTSNVTDMTGMFQSCHALTSLDVSGFNTSKVTDMSYMFNRCYVLTSLDVSGFDTSNVTNMRSMFQQCKALTSLDVSGFNTSKVTDMSYMFNRCYVLTSLDVSGFDTSNVTGMRAMFSECFKLESINLDNFIFNDVNAVNMFSMVSNTENQRSSSLQGLITINGRINDYTGFFENTTNLIVLKGNSPQLQQLTTTSENNNVKVWSLNIKPVAERDENNGALLHVSVEVTRFAGNNGAVDIKVYRNDSSTPISLVWHESLIMDVNPKIFTTEIGNVDENTSTNYTFVVSDAYGTGLSKTITVPTNYYTIDFLKEGKEISFGEKADIDDFYEALTEEPEDWLTNFNNYYRKIEEDYKIIEDTTKPSFVVTDPPTFYKKIHESLFKCSMGTSFNDMEQTEVNQFISELDISGSPIELTQADWVVEQGITGDWTWRKWQSGIAECWGMFLHNTTVSGAWGNGFLSNVKVINFPTDLFVSPPSGMSAYVDSTWVGLSACENQIATKDWMRCFVFRTSSTGTTAADFYIHVDAKGRWK